MTSCNFINESGIFNVNIYIDMKTVYCCLLNSFSNYLKKSLYAWIKVFFFKFVIINPTFCVGSGILLFQGRFCAYAPDINEVPRGLSLVLLVILNCACVHKRNRKY